MKTLITLVTLTLITVAAHADYQIGGVKPIQCGTNSMVPMGSRVGFISQICSVNVQGIGFKTPLYTVDYTSNRGERTTFLYQQVSSSPVMTTNAFAPSNSRLFMLKIQVVGTVVRGKFNQITFVRAPEVDSVVMGYDRQNNQMFFTGNIKILGGSYNFPVRIDEFKPVYTTM